MIDYRELLIKYIAHIGAEEGITFIDPWRMADRFTDEEQAELERLDREQRNLRISRK